MGQAADDIGKLTISLRLGESATVSTPDGDVQVRCVRANGSKHTALSIQIIAPKSFNIERSSGK